MKSIFLPTWRHAVSIVTIRHPHENELQRNYMQKNVCNSANQYFCFNRISSACKWKWIWIYEFRTTTKKTATTEYGQKISVLRIARHSHIKSICSIWPSRCLVVVAVLLSNYDNGSGSSSSNNNRNNSYGSSSKNNYSDWQQELCPNYNKL